MTSTNTRRRLLKAGLLGLGLGFRPVIADATAETTTADPDHNGIQAGGQDAGTQEMTAVATWNHGVPANAAGFGILAAGGRALDAVEAGVRVVEADPTSTTVGLGGFPDREGRVTLDACIMDERGEAGAVAFLENILHPVSVARQVMEHTPHLMLVGEGAYEFAIAQGFPKQELLTPEARQAWIEWREKQQSGDGTDPWPEINIENHDTIGMLALDSAGNLAGACTTSGTAFKMRGRVGDSPIIGAGLFVDNDVGAATATGLGELVIKTAGSHAVVEMMRQGQSPQTACLAVLQRITDKYPDAAGRGQVGFLAMNRQGDVGAAALQPGFTYAVQQAKDVHLLEAASLATTGITG